MSKQIDISTLGLSKNFTGRVKYKDKSYIYEKGKRCVGKDKYVVKTKKGVTYGASKTGKMLTGLHVIHDQFYYFKSDGKLDEEKTDKLRKLGKKGTPVHKFRMEAGKPKETKYYGGSRFHYKGEHGLKDGEWRYKNFKLITCKLANGKEIVVEYE